MTMNSNDIANSARAVVDTARAKYYKHRAAYYAAMEASEESKE
jgi:hypothetical protein